jgi:hypothetical protein
MEAGYLFRVKSYNMKIKTAIWIFVLGYSLDFIGAWMKITHQVFADFALGIAAILKIIGLVLLALFFFRHPKVKQFLEHDQYSDSFK